MVRHLAAVSLLIVTSCVVVACSGSDSSPGGDGDPPPGGNPPPGGGNGTSTGTQRDEFCTLAVTTKECDVYERKPGNCTVDHTNVASCYLTSITKCVKGIATPCDLDNYDACMKEAAISCDSNANAPYYKSCMDKDKSCKAKGEIDQDGYIAIEDTCNLLRGLDATGRADGAECVAGPCSNLEECLARITP